MAISRQHMKAYQKKLEATVRFLKKQLGPAPNMVIVFGSGLGDVLIRQRKPDKTLPYGKIPHFNKLTVQGHRGLMHFYGKQKQYRSSALVFHGRGHFYEGLSPETLVFPYRAVALWGVKRVLITNSAGSLKKALKTGTLVRIRDHINLMGFNPLIGPNLDRLGPRFPSLQDLYVNPFSKQIGRSAKKLRIPLRDGIYVGISGPSYETPAEVGVYQKMGGDLVGMSTVPEAIAAAHAGMEVAALSAVTNSAIHPGVSTSHEEVLKRAHQVDLKLSKVLLDLLKTQFKED